MTMSMAIIAVSLGTFYNLIPITSLTSCPDEVEQDPNVDEKWQLFCYGDPTVPIYLSEDTNEFLNLCGSVGNEVCPEVTDEVVTETGCIVSCNKRRLQVLVRGKNKVIAIKNQVGNLQRSGLLGTLWFTIAILGFILYAVRQFKVINLPIVGNPFVDDPTDGIKFKHYKWMKWKILGNKNCHWLTYIKPDAFLFHWQPLSKQPWDRPMTPPGQRKFEPRDHEHPPWVIEDIIWAKQEDESKEAEPTWNVLEEYWVKIYSWAWERYRYRKAPHIVHRASEASCREL